MRKIYFATLWNQGYEYVRISGGLSPPKAEEAGTSPSGAHSRSEKHCINRHVWFHGLVQPAVVFQSQQLNQLCEETAIAFFSSYEQLTRVST